MNGLSAEDVLEYTPESGTFELAYDGDDEHAGWLGADLQAVSASTMPPQVIVAPAPGPPPPNAGGGNTVFPSSTRVSGQGTARAKPGDTCIEIFDAGANGVPDDPPGSVDDVLLGIGGTDEHGAFVAADGTLGIPVVPPLFDGQRIFATDVCADLTGAVLRVSFVAPARCSPTRCCLSQRS